ncbi:hypothetical protein SAMN02745165_00530 [Malonomonas rubra DSM 5091]|uniref:Uncharacterized protein n=1 Tax=Malonomonas rubra DSM 5091 TaxID=1122189 RepID=A0A1M6CHQ9_MALRU|nr:choice-of-anchor F family protein [Malonomonas rubra]SHI60453.1 hypothetical protein SAMN02745165_00530 [Malonomonas rubra DSM 5091]
MKLKKVATFIAGMTLVAGMANAGTIDGWDESTYAVPAGPYTEYETYGTAIYNADGLSNGVMIWKESDVQNPGMKVVHNDDVDGSNCLMVTGYNPYDLSDKQCSDDLKSSKRWKIKHYTNGNIDVKLNVTPGSTKTVYRSYQKITDGTDVKWAGFTAQLGYMDGGTFVPSTAGDGLGFVDRKNNFITSTSSAVQPDVVLSANFAQGLAGPADKYHPEPGYFDPFARFVFELNATEDSLATGAQSTNYTDLVGPWNNTDSVPFAYFYDDDQDPNTDNLLMANCEGPYTVINEETEEIICDGEWVTYRSQEGLDANGAPYESDGVRKVVSAATVAAWQADQWYNTGSIDDLANLGLNYSLAIDSNYDKDNFVIRFTPIPAE